MRQLTVEKLFDALTDIALEPHGMIRKHKPKSVTGNSTRDDRTCQRSDGKFVPELGASNALQKPSSASGMDQ